VARARARLYHTCRASCLLCPRESALLRHCQRPDALENNAPASMPSGSAHLLAYSPSTPLTNDKRVRLAHQTTRGASLPPEATRMPAGPKRAGNRRPHQPIGSRQRLQPTVAQSNMSLPSALRDRQPYIAPPRDWSSRNAFIRDMALCSPPTRAGGGRTGIGAREARGAWLALIRGDSGASTGSSAAHPVASSTLTPTLYTPRAETPCSLLTFDSKLKKP